MSSGPRPTSIRSGILIHPAIWPQQIWAENWGGGSAPFLRRRLTQCRLDRGLPPYGTKWHLDASSRLATIEIDRKLGRGCAPFLGGERGPYRRQCRLGLGVPPYQVASWSIQPFGHKRYGHKIVGCALWVGPHPTQCGQGRGLHAKFHLDSSKRLATINQRHRQDRLTGQDR